MSEQDVRQMRDNIYGPQSNEGWANVRDRWMTPENIQWLIEHQPPWPRVAGGNP